MKTLLKVSAISTATLWLFTFFIVLSSCLTSCDKPTDSVNPATGWNGATLTGIIDNEPSGFMLIGNLTEPPRNLSVNVYYFPVGTPAIDAINGITDPGTDEDGEPMDAPDPDDSFDVVSGKTTTNYNAKGQFGLYLLEMQLAVLEVSDGQRTTYAAIETAGSAKNATFDLTKARSAKATAAAKTSEKFSVTDGSEGGEYVTAVNFRIWYQDTEPAQQWLDELYDDASHANSQFLPASKPSQNAKVAARIGAGGYTKKKYFTKSLTAERWALVEVTFPDGIAKVGRNKYNTLFFKLKADAVKDINKIRVADAFRAGIN